MDEPLRQHKPQGVPSWGALFRRLPLEAETTRFILVSALDVFMTYLLLRFSAEDRLTVPIYESNPIARFFLNHWGPKGMVYFKFIVVAFVTTLAQIIATRQPRTAQKLLNFASILVGCVVIYSLSLFVKHSVAS